MPRKIIIKLPGKKMMALNSLLRDGDVMSGLEDRNIEMIPKIHKDDKDNSVSMELYGYDREIKYKTDQLIKGEFLKMFDMVDMMPIRQMEMKMKKDKSKNKSKQVGGDMELYSDKNPGSTLEGTGYKDKETAEKTIKLVEKRSLIYQKAVVNTMYHRAKNHKNQTPEMKEAMRVFKTWIKKHRKDKPTYDYLKLDLVKTYEKLADEYNISRVARGLKPPSKTSRGFLEVYKKARGKKAKLPFIPTFKDNPEGQDYDSYIESFLNARLGQMKAAKTKLYYTSGKYKGLPTKQHVILIMHAYSPDPTGIRAKVGQLKELDNK